MHTCGRTSTYERQSSSSHVLYCPPPCCFETVSLTEPRIYQLASLAYIHIRREILTILQTISKEDGPVWDLLFRALERDPGDAQQSL